MNNSDERDAMQFLVALAVTVTAFVLGVCYVIYRILT